MLKSTLKKFMVLGTLVFSLFGAVSYAGAITAAGVSVNKPVAVDNAAFVSQNVPTTLISGQTYNVSVTMLNNGTTTWSSNGPYDPSGYYLYDRNGYYSYDNPVLLMFGVPVPVQVLPGQKVTFNFKIYAPGVSVTTVFNLQCQMSKKQSGIPNGFGALAPKLSVTVYPAGSANISGTVTDAVSHSPIANAQVSVEIDGGFYPASNINVPFTPQSSVIPSLSGYIWGQRVIATTDNTGAYKVNIQLSDIPYPYRYAKIVVARLQGSPIYQTQTELIPLPPQPVCSVGCIPSYQANFQLPQIAYGAFVSGVVQDHATNELIPAGFVYVAFCCYNLEQGCYCTGFNYCQFFVVVSL